MLTLKLINEETRRVIRGLEEKHFRGAHEAIEKVLEYNHLCRKTQQKLDTDKQQQSQLSEQTGELMKGGEKDEADKIEKEVALLKSPDKAFQETMGMTQKDMTDVLLTIPDIPNKIIPEDKNVEDNAVVREGGERPSLPADALYHWDLLEKLNLVDFDLGVKITGAGFPLYIGKMARSQRVLEVFSFDEARKGGYLEVQPPLVVNRESGRATGRLPDKEGQMYHANLDDLYLIPTAEVPVTSIFHDEVPNEQDPPIKRCTYSVYPHREAGSYGKDVCDLNRLHQFDKVKIVCTDRPEYSYQSLDEMLDRVGGLSEKPESPYHILHLCGGGISSIAALYYDFEVQSAAQGCWLEMSSVSNFEDYQASHLHCCFHYVEDEKIELCHTLNGSALTLPRITAAVIENDQTPEDVRVPRVLVPHYGFEMLDDKVN